MQRYRAGGHYLVAVGVYIFHFGRGNAVARARYAEYSRCRAVAILPTIVIGIGKGERYFIFADIYPVIALLNAVARI